MSYRSLFAQLISKLSMGRFGVQVKDGDGNMVDTGSQAVIDYLRGCLSSKEPIVISEPIRIQNTGKGPAFVVVNSGESIKLIEGYDPDGRYVSLGIGMGSEGIIANEVLLLPNYAIDPELFHQKYTNAGDRGGVTSCNPAFNPTIWGPFRSCESFRWALFDAIGSGYGQGRSGSGYRGDIIGGNDTFFATPTSFGGGGGDGTGGGGGLFYGTITAIGNDSITVTLLTGESVSVAKPYYLRKTTFDGETVNGITYTYSDSQHRSASDGVSSASQVIIPLYTVGDEILVGETPDGNNVAGATHMDVNSDGRVWSELSEDC